MPRQLSPRSMSLDTDSTAAEDLKAFERRLTEVVESMRPQARRWRIILAINGLALIIGAYRFVMDPDMYTAQSLFQHFCNHQFFLICSIIFAISLLYGIHYRVVAPDIIVARTRLVLADFNMSCDDSGHLILNSRPVSAS